MPRCERNAKIPVSQTVALVATALGMLSACGFIPERSSPPPQIYTAPARHRLELSARVLAFQAKIHESSVARTLVIRNADFSEVPLHISIQAGPGSEQFRQQMSCRAVLSSGDSCVVSLAYTATSSARTSAVLSINAGTDDEQTVLLVGLTPAPNP